MIENNILFHTATIQGWKNLLKPDKNKQVIINSLQFLVNNNRIWIYSFVIMPNHIHLLWKIREPHFLNDVQRDFLKYTSQMIKFDLEKNHPSVLSSFASERKDRKYQFWQDRSYNKQMFNRKVLEQKLEYIHNNPLSKKWNLVEKPDEYKFSTAKFYLENIDDWGFVKHYREDI
ncbi:MAG: transposase [Bacteroidetes bacterium GWA2_31_9]|nr:MAG: transposase [Bacteroidetes bacterium GWA2_31_9]